MKVALKALGCRLNEAELEHWAAGFRADGHQLSRQTDDADLIVINTCAVTGAAAKKSRQLLRRAQRRNAQAKLVVSGCYSSLQPDAVQQLPGIDLIVDNSDKDRLVEIVRQHLSIEAMPATAMDAGETALFARGRNRAFVKVQDGCRHKCTYCVVTLARGAERSRSIHSIVNEINSLHSHQILEVVLTGVHIGGYGHDLGADLTALIKAILADTDLPRLRLGSMEPWDLPDTFYQLFGNPRFMPHLHLPLQSGSDRVLTRMGRRCKSADFMRLAQTLRQAVPDMNITTDIIAGFPGETEQEWQATLDFCQQIGFSHIHVFPYSMRSGTRAAALPGQLPAEIKKQRCRELHSLAQRMKHDYMNQHSGRRYQVLVESDVGELNGQMVRFGYSPNYLRTAIPITGAGPGPNSIVTALIRRYDERGATLIADAHINGTAVPQDASLPLPPESSACR